MQRDRGVGAAARWSLTAVLAAACCTGTAAAHPGTVAGAAGLAFWQVLAAVAVGSLALGVAAGSLVHRLPDRTPAVSSRVLHAALLVVGATLVAPLLSDASTAVVAAVAVGVFGGALAPLAASASTVTPALATGGVFAHRAVEGVALAGVYAADSAVTLLGVAVLTGHAALEVAVVYAANGDAPRRAWLAALGAQAVPVVVAAAAFALGAVSLPAQQAVVAAAGGALLATGVRAGLPSHDETDAAPE
ncbi:MAG: hypothetical protein ABEH83_03225 [Halobacterium sp.]